MTRPLVLGTVARARRVAAGRRAGRGAVLAATALAIAAPARAQTSPPGSGAPLPASEVAKLPWMDRALDADRRAALVVAAMTRAEKIRLLHGYRPPPGTPSASNGGAGFVPGIPRLGFPDINMADSAVGVARGAQRSRYATLMPSTVAEAATWDPDIARDYGALIGRELRAQGYNVSLAGGVNLMREPRNGRNFEYRSEDPVLTGVMAGQFLRGLQAQKVVGELKHYAYNDQETGRYVGAVRIGRAAGRESDLLAFEIGIRDGDPGMVMCAYNKVETDWACENDYLLNRVLKGAWGFKGFVVSDWGGTHSTAKAIAAGLDQEQPGQTWFVNELDAAVTAGAVSEARLDDMARRVVRALFASGAVDDPPRPMVVDIAAGLEVSQRVAERSMVLLKNDGVLPLAAGARSVLLVGSHADVGVLTGGGSAQVDPPGGNAVKGGDATVDLGAAGTFSRAPVWYPSSPLRAMQAALPSARVSFDSGDDPAAAATAARSADMVVVFANQPSTEGADAKTLSLPGAQDALIAAVAAANPRTIVVLETGGAVTMPWLADVKAVVAAWYPGARGGEAIARLLTGQANFSGKLPMSFPRTEADLPNPVVPGSTLADVPMIGPDGRPVVDGAGRTRMSPPPFDINYPEGADVGYRWFERTGRLPLFAFGHGLSYTRYDYADLAVNADGARFTVRNAGAVAGTEIAQVYATVPGRRTRRLVGWSRVDLQPGERKQVAVRFEPLAMSVFDTDRDGWVQPRGRYRISVGGGSSATALRAEVRR